MLCCIGLAWEYGYVPETRHKQPDDLTVPDLFECGKVSRRCCAWAPGLASVVFGRTGPDEECLRLCFCFCLYTCLF